jgi:hypothetical protein
MDDEISEFLSSSFPVLVLEVVIIAEHDASRRKPSRYLAIYLALVFLGHGRPSEMPSNYTEQVVPTQHITAT